METGEGWKIGMMLVLLLGFGLAYNEAVARVERSRYSRWVNTALLVVMGVMVTIACTLPMIGWKDTLIVFGCFAASGAPMAAGSYLRQIRRHQEDYQQAKALLSGGLMNDAKENRRLPNEE